MIATLRSVYGRFTAMAGHAEPAALLFMRLALASVFWRSALTKVETIQLFQIPFPSWLQNLTILFRSAEGPFRVRLPLPIIKEDTFYLFREEFFGDYFPEGCWEEPVSGGCAAGFFVVDVGAFFATIGELAFPILLALGLLTRLGAFGLLAMTMVIQILVFPSFSHWINPAMWWAAAALLLVARGGGAWSLDRRFGLG